MSFRIDDSKLLKKYCKIWKKIKKLLRIELGSGRVYGDGDSYVKTKKKNYDNKVNTNFQGKEVPKEDSSYKHLPLIMLDSVVKVGKKYYPQVFLEEGKYVKRKNKMINYIDDDLEISGLHEMMIMDLLVNQIVNLKIEAFFLLYNFFDILSFFPFFLLKCCFSFFLYIFFYIFSFLLYLLQTDSYIFLSYFF